MAFTATSLVQSIDVVEDALTLFINPNHIGCSDTKSAAGIPIQNQAAEGHNNIGVLSWTVLAVSLVAKIMSLVDGQSGSWLDDAMALSSRECLAGPGFLDCKYKQKNLVCSVVAPNI
jgi:hypothetical protein